ncbi:MAG TPA: DUF1835 domain-containing protein [Gemmatimonadaceae bacterium]|nr:DUF1835 domain-containing protein [Gemmatimonadaceae bacterium]
MPTTPHGHVLHITNGDSATAGIRAAEPTGDVLPWRDVLHEGPVPTGVSLAELSRIRAEFLAREEMGDREQLERSFAERDDCLRRFADYDEVVLWFEWDLYDQLQLLQLLDFFANHTDEDLAETGTRISIVCIEGYLGVLGADEFAPLYSARSPVTRDMLELGRKAWASFRSDDPTDLERIVADDCSTLPFLPGALHRHLEEFPSIRNGLSRSERQILEAVAQGPLSFADIFRQTTAREERVYCGDATLARYIERMSRHAFPLLAHPTGEPIDAPHTEQDSRAFRNSEIALTTKGREVLRCERDWIALGGSDRWLGGVHLGPDTRWRWVEETGTLKEIRS